MRTAVFLAVLAVLALAVAAQAPDSWTCQDVIYNANDACDCDCGAFDPDCDRLSFTRGCNAEEGFVSFCDALGECQFVERDVPDNWYCDDIAYNNGDGICNCGCGAVDPDCKEGSTVAECDNGLFPTCSADGFCEYGAPLPEGWVCSGYAYDTNNGCDCSCGIEDPDCATQPDVVLGCPCEEMTCVLGFCSGFCEGRMLSVTSTVEARDVEQSIEDVSIPFEDVRDVDKRNINRGVAESTIKRYIHSTRPTVHTRRMLQQWGVWDDEETSPMSIARRAPKKARSARSDPPAEWTCNPAYFDAQDGCDCECGAIDPDCADVTAYVYGCVGALPEDEDGDIRPACNDQGRCTFREIEIPDAWRCDPNYYAYSDGCDCQCGVHDPDCDQDGSFVYNCNRGYDPVCTDQSECAYLTPIPDGWNCPYYYYEDGECDCNCGVQDPDCDAEHDVIYGCGRCNEPAVMACQEGLCVGECLGVFLSFEVLEDYSPLLKPGAPDIDDLYNDPDAIINAGGNGNGNGNGGGNGPYYSPFSFSAQSPLSPGENANDDDDDDDAARQAGNRASFGSSDASAVSASVALLAIAAIAAF